MASLGVEGQLLVLACACLLMCWPHVLVASESLGKPGQGPGQEQGVTYRWASGKRVGRCHGPAHFVCVTAPAKLTAVTACLELA